VSTFKFDSCLKAQYVNRMFVVIRVVLILRLIKVLLYLNHQYTYL